MGGAALGVGPWGDSSGASREQRMVSLPSGIPTPWHPAPASLSAPVTSCTAGALCASGPLGPERLSLACARQVASPGRAIPGVSTHGLQLVAKPPSISPAVSLTEDLKVNPLTSPERKRKQKPELESCANLGAPCHSLTSASPGPHWTQQREARNEGADRGVGCGGQGGSV